MQYFFNFYTMEIQFQNIINTEIVSSEMDIFWEFFQDTNLGIKETLVFSLPFTIQSKEEQQLLKMLGACKLNPDHYQVIQLANKQKFPWHILKEQTRATKVLLLGVLPAQLGIDALMILHEVNNYDGVQWIPTFALDQIVSNDALKKHLWVNVFQKVFF
jgi:hypothetical protein